MTMTSTKLMTELKGMGLFEDEASAINAWVDAWAEYFKGSQAGTVPFNVLSIEAPKAAMAGAMDGLSTAGASAIQAGITAFWGVLMATPPSYYAGATVIAPPPGLPTISADLQLVFDNNRDTEATADAAYDAIASDLHTNNSGGTATIAATPQTIV